MQAAVLRARLPLLPGWTTRRRALAARYRAALVGAPIIVPPERDSGHVYHLFPVRSPYRDAFQSHLRTEGIETLVHYPVPIPRQPALAGVPVTPCPIAAQVCDDVFSLPLHPALTDAEVDRVAEAVHAFRG